MFSHFALLATIALTLSSPKGPKQVSPKHKQEVAFARVNPAKMLTEDVNWIEAAREVQADQGRIDRQLHRLSEEELNKYVVRKGSTRGLKIALTFDDGPHPDFTPKLVEILKEEKIPATFFMIGHMAETYPQMVRLVNSAGFEIANHTYSHVTLTKITNKQAATEYRACSDMLQRLTGKPVHYCRPPGGDFDLNVLEAASVLGLKTVLWTDDPGDYDNPGDHVLLESEISKLSPGGIILLHDGSKDTLDTLKQFIQSCKQRGYHFVTLDELTRN